MRISDWSSDVCSSDLLPKQRLKAEGGAEVRVQLALEVGGRAIMAGHHVAPEAGDQPLLLIIEDAVAIDGGDPVPVDRRRAPMRQGRRRIEGGTSRADVHKSEVQTLIRTSYDVCCLKHTTWTRHTRQEAR